MTFGWSCTGKGRSTARHSLPISLARTVRVELLVRASVLGDRSLDDPKLHARELRGLVRATVLLSLIHI